MRTVEAAPALIPFLLVGIGEARRQALDARCNGNAEAAIAANIAASTLTWCGIDAGGVVNMGGMMPIADRPGAGYVWQFIADIGRHKRAYIEQGRTAAARGLAQYERLICVIEPDYSAALRHIRRLGFTVGAPAQINGQLGCSCERSR